MHKFKIYNCFIFYIMVDLSTFKFGYRLESSPEIIAYPLYLTRGRP